MKAKQTDWEKLPFSIRDVFTKLSSDLYAYMDIYKMESSNAFFSFIAIALKDTPFGKKNSRLVGIVSNGVFSDVFVKSYPLGSEDIIKSIDILHNLTSNHTREEFMEEMKKKGYLHFRVSTIA